MKFTFSAEGNLKNGVMKKSDSKRLIEIKKRHIKFTIEAESDIFN